MKEEDLKQSALKYHEEPVPGKISIAPTKALKNSHDLSLAYSPGVALPCMEIFHHPETASRYTSRGNLVGVISNGTAVLGLGNIGPLASKPVMEGKGCLFKRFGDVDVFDLEIAETDPARFVDVVAALEPTLGGINLEDIKAPDCFYIERELKKRVSIPVFHDDQHGTAIISSAALINAMRLVGKSLSEIRVVSFGAGAASIACLNQFVQLGVRLENIIVCDSRGVIYQGREKHMEENKARYAQVTDKRTLADAVVGTDVFLGCAVKDLLTPEMVKTMNEQPLIMALANPDPEIVPQKAKAVRSDCIVCTGRSDYPNQVNNVLCFPFMFRGALDVGATEINEEMKKAAVYAIAGLVDLELTQEVLDAYPNEHFEFGQDYIIPKPFDPRLITSIAPAVAQAAMDSGVATRPIHDMEAYKVSLRERMKKNV